eukprot:3214155-Prymnesium_polylepis.1
MFDPPAGARDPRVWELQLAVAETATAGRDTAALWPPGTGKSVLLRRAAAAGRFRVFDVTPLSMLNKDQLVGTGSFGLGVRVNILGKAADNTPRAEREACDGEDHFVFCCPETIC